MAKLPAVYILTNSRNGSLYTGVTSNLQKRAWEHKNNFVDGFSNRYSTHMLVYYETHDNMMNAITREKQIKGWKRAWKIHLIEKANPYWRDLYPEIV
ncbi:MAG: GIY-YIG nuclease family protein [Gammaproteobacteria bacterium]